MDDSPLFLLASGSPRRRDLLQALGLPFQVVPNPWEEVEVPGEKALPQVQRLAREKLGHFVDQHPENTLPVLTADTLLSLDGRPLNKPADAGEAWSFYRRLAGRTHLVHTCVALWSPLSKAEKTVTTRVTFVAWDEALYRRYLERQEWRDAAGGYKIQETGSILVRRLVGSWTNVVGLPTAEVYGMILATLRIQGRQTPRMS